jgi:hypothetical protein
MVAQLVKKFPAFYGTRRFMTVFTRARHWSLSWVRWIQSTPSHLISLRLILILSSHLGVRLPSVLFRQVFHQNFYGFPITTIRATFPVQLKLLDLITLTIFGGEYKLWSSSLCNFLQSPVTFSFQIFSYAPCPVRNNTNFYGEGLAPRPAPKLDVHLLSAVLDCLFNIFAATLRIWRTSLHPQPEDAPCRDDKGLT